MRKVIVSVVLAAMTVFGGERTAVQAPHALFHAALVPASALALPFSAGSGPATLDAPLSWNTPNHPVFYDKPLMLKQYGFGIVASMVAGPLGFYIGNAFEGAIFGGDSHKGYLSFTGIRYKHKRGPFWGSGAGVLFGSAFTVFFVGDTDEEQGSILWTLAGGALTTAAAFALADAAGVQEERGLLPFVPLLALPSVGAVGGYHVSRWFNDNKRRRITEPQGGGEAEATGPLLHAPRVGMVPGPDGMVLRMDALNLTF